MNKTIWTTSKKILFFIKQELIQNRLQSLVSKVGFLNKGSPDFIVDVIEKLNFEVYLTGDIIIQAGRQGDAMYFIEHGTVKIEVEGRTVGNLHDGDHFGGENVFIFGVWKHLLWQ